MNKLEKLGAKIISNITIGGQFGWPPDCYGICYQPERPMPSHSQRSTDNSHPEQKKRD